LRETLFHATALLLERVFASLWLSGYSETNFFSNPWLSPAPGTGHREKTLRPFTGASVY